MSENPKRPGQDPTEKERFEVLLEEVRSELKTLADGYAQLNPEMKEGFRQVREEIHQRFSLVEQALKENSQELRRLTDRIDSHEEAHAP